MIANNITNVRDQWPLSNNDLHEMMLDKYGSYEALENIHHYETTGIFDEDNRTILPEGLEVDKDFQYSYYGTNSTITTNPVVPVTNYQYESKRNDEKRKIAYETRIRLVVSRTLTLKFDEVRKSTPK